MLNTDYNRAPEKINTIHIMGICGTGMAALAGMLKHSGYTVTGSDSHVYPPMSDFLEQIGIQPFDGYGKDNLLHKPDLVIVGNVITKKNPEAQALAQTNIPYLSFPQALSEFFIRFRKSLVVTGTHGKTTTCSILASALFHAGLDPSFMIGGIVSEFQSNNRIGKGLHFVSEGDEYDTAFFDKESKFLHYRPQVAIITSIEFDHADIFDDITQIKNSFRKFIKLLPPDGLIIANLDDPNVAEVVAEAQCPVEGYGFGKTNDWILIDFETVSKQTKFRFEYKGKKHQLTIPLSGKHNCLNSLAVAAVLHHLDTPFATIEKSIQLFGGVKRRQEVRGVVQGITVIDDFAHHPTAVKETLEGLKLANKDNRLVTVFEPRTNSSRRSIFQKQYITSFADADVVLLREPIPLDNVSADDHFSSTLLAKELRKENHDVWAFKTTKEILEHLSSILKKGDIVAILSNGGFDNIHERLLEILHSRK